MVDDSSWMQSTVTLIILGAMIPTYGNIKCDTAGLLMHTLLSSRMLLIGTDSNCGESIQMLLKKTQIKTCCYIKLRRGEGKLSAFQYI